MAAKDGKRRTVMLGVTGSIAAYKACELVRLFVRQGDDVHVAMTRHACEFVAPLTFQTLSRNPVSLEMFDAPSGWRPEHVGLAEAADLVVVAPATANIIAKMAHGIADDLLSSMLLATRAPILVAPAMNEGMYLNAATQANIAALRSRGVRFVDPAAGELACGSVGTGRLAPVEDILAAANAL
ncbi:MAG: phosphopantothenoylcysteine decarboxylase [Kiritimatiellae bacterium]|nr:phosphopantothenoylcysteine decarboxylase [Kiritimatiellia bacterium]